VLSEARGDEVGAMTNLTIGEDGGLKVPDNAAILPLHLVEPQWRALYVGVRSDRARRFYEHHEAPVIFILTIPISARHYRNVIDATTFLVLYR
jgi:hypothetical protein